MKSSYILHTWGLPVPVSWHGCTAVGRQWLPYGSVPRDLIYPRID